MVDDEIAASIQAGDFREATRLAVSTYGAELFGYIASLVGDEAVASDAFGTTCECVLTGIAAFRGHSSVRTWLYAIARHAAYREARRERRWRGEPARLLQDEIAAAVRTATATFRKTEVRDGIARLRESLSAEERELLLLRVDRQLSWNDIAIIQLAPLSGDEDAVRSTAARCRKQFERAKQKLRKLAQKEGLIRARDDD